MKAFPFYCLALLLLLSGLANAQQAQTLHYKDGKKFMEGRWRHELSPRFNKMQYTREINLNDQLVDLADVQDRLEDILDQIHCEGALQLWYENGTKAWDAHFSRGVLQGAAAMYTPSGRKQYEGYFRDGMPDSVWKLYYPTGGLAWTGSFTAYTQEELSSAYRDAQEPYCSEKPCISRSYFNQRTEVEAFRDDYVAPVLFAYERFLMRNTKRNGTYTFYGLSGRKEVEISYRNSLKDGSVSLYLDDGRLLGTVQYKDDTLVATAADSRWPVLVRSNREYWPVEPHADSLLPPRTYGNPTFPGGDSALVRFLRQNYHPDAGLYGFGAKGYFIDLQTVALVIAEDGSVHNVRPVGTALFDDDFRLAAALRNMPRWVWPKGYDRKKISFQFLTVHRGREYPE